MEVCNYYFYLQNWETNLKNIFPSKGPTELHLYNFNFEFGLQLACLNLETTVGILCKSTYKMGYLNVFPIKIDSHQRDHNKHRLTDDSWYPDSRDWKEDPKVLLPKMQKVGRNLTCHVTTLLQCPKKKGSQKKLETKKCYWSKTMMKGIALPIS